MTGNANGFNNVNSSDSKDDNQNGSKSKDTRNNSNSYSSNDNEYIGQDEDEKEKEIVQEERQELTENTPEVRQEVIIFLLHVFRYYVSLYI